MKSQWLRAVLANNLKYHRSESDLSQKEIAKKTGLSYRLIQDLESGSGNPTIETMHAISVAFKVTAASLLELSHLRLNGKDGDFQSSFRAKFKDAKVGASLRTLSGVALWSNKKTERLFGLSHLDKGPFDLMDVFPPDLKGLLKNQFAAERAGIAFHYCLTIINPKTKENLFIRARPTLMLPSKGKNPAFAAVYLAEFSEDCEENYYEYCRLLLGAVYNE